MAGRAASGAHAVHASACATRAWSSDAGLGTGPWTYGGCSAPAQPPPPSGRRTTREGKQGKRNRCRRRRSPRRPLPRGGRRASAGSPHWASRWAGSTGGSLPGAHTAWPPFPPAPCAHTWLSSASMAVPSMLTKDSICATSRPRRTSTLCRQRRGLPGPGGSGGRAAAMRCGHPGLAASTVYACFRHFPLLLECPCSYHTTAPCICHTTVSSLFLPSLLLPLLHPARPAWRCTPPQLRGTPPASRSRAPQNHQSLPAAEGPDSAGCTGVG